MKSAVLSHIHEHQERRFTLYGAFKVGEVDSTIILPVPENEAEIILIRDLSEVSNVGRFELYPGSPMSKLGSVGQ